MAGRTGQGRASRIEQDRIGNGMTGLARILQSRTGRTYSEGQVTEFALRQIKGFPHAGFVFGITAPFLVLFCRTQRQATTFFAVANTRQTLSYVPGMEFGTQFTKKN